MHANASLSNRDIQRAFDDHVRDDGWQYYQAGRVRLLDGTSDRMSASVRGTEPYTVTVIRDGGKLDVTCTCPYVSKCMSPCKHIWAALLAAEEKGYLKDPWGPAPQEVVLTVQDRFPPTAPEMSAKVLPFPLSKERQRRRAIPPWGSLLHAVETRQAAEQAARKPWPAGRQIVYALDPNHQGLDFGGLPVRVGIRDRRKDGSLKEPQFRGISGSFAESAPEPQDRRILGALLGAGQWNQAFYQYYGDECRLFVVPQALAMEILPAMCRTGRFVVIDSARSDVPLEWDEGPAWDLRVEVTEEGRKGRYRVQGRLSRGQESMAVLAPWMVGDSGLLFVGNRIMRLARPEWYAWLRALRENAQASISKSEALKFLRRTLETHNLPPLLLPEELSYREKQVKPARHLRVKPMREGADRLIAEVWFDYEGRKVAAEERAEGIFEADERLFIRRDAAEEEAALERLQGVGLRWDRHQPYMTLHASRLSKVVSALTSEGWNVEAEGKVYRTPGAIRIEVISGIDWFDVHGGVKFDGVEVAFPELLAAVHRGQNFVRLGDGSIGLLPEDWLKQNGVWLDLGKRQEKSLRFARSQAFLLEMLLASEPTATFDASFEDLRKELGGFEAIKPADPPSTFKGTLRPYQKDGLGWFGFLRRCGFGGILADDMGLGKTVQVLALLEERRIQAAGGPRTTSLVVVPKSLVFNWLQEAAKFAPALKVLDYTGPARKLARDRIGEHDVVLTTYGILRQDAEFLKDLAFDYLVLDEAQAVKNAHTASAKAARLLKGRHRLCMSGTPVENHLGELWSLMEFLNPGMLGSVGVFEHLTRLDGKEDPAARKMLGKVLRPFILRRTKEFVAKDLPAKTEQTLYCDLEPKGRRYYEELRDYYRVQLRNRIKLEGIQKAKIMILEALLRLRQAACHPGLIDKDKAKLGSAKLDLLSERLDEVMEEGHKALVFSQFTSLLAILRERLDAKGVVYEYLDGQTQDRQARVERFQKDPSRRLFLISLKAGGLGLNLTAAEYVFLLDPWWNPAAEAQAIDRTHRIGQTRQVFAYRIIARNTVEEKVLQLQEGKRELADAILGGDEGLMRTLTAEDLKILLS